MVDIDKLCAMNLKSILAIISIIFVSRAIGSQLFTSEMEDDIQKHLAQVNPQQTQGPFFSNDDDLPSLLDKGNNLFKYTRMHNLTNVSNDTHLYYNSSFIAGENAAKILWVDIDKQKDAKISDLLSNSHRRATTIKLKFEFPFYGHLVSKVTIATGGFLYTGEYVHSWLAATQYIAPLMANFDTSLSNNSFIKHYDNGTAFTVQWENVTLQEMPQLGNFTFQTTIFNDGRILFVYKHIPYSIYNITDDHHPVKVGISDAYINDRIIFFVRRKTIYEYHNVNFKQAKISNWTAIHLIPLPTCIANKDCKSCFTKSVQFTCYWCPSTNRCSSGIDRYRQEWFDKNCTFNNISKIEQCSLLDTSTSHSLNPVIIESSTMHIWNDDHDISHKSSSQKIISHNKVNSEQYSTSFMFSFICILFVIGSVISWTIYAYLNPHTISGQFLIRYRPSHWSLKRGEARYTAASIHI